jgi:ACS family tartrate transporter-like MFS transporter
MPRKPISPKPVSLIQAVDAMNQSDTARPVELPVREKDLRQSVLRNVTWRLVPFLCLLYFFNILDRSNVGFARSAMERDLGMSVEAFDIGFGIFYLGYLTFEVPANMLLRRYGARRWIARIMISWGMVSCLTMAVADAWNFYLVRILLGVAEAGFFPGIILYLTYWFPTQERARIVALFMIAISLSGLVGNPISGLIMQHLDDAMGLHGWQWLFLLEGLPSVVLGIVALGYLTDGPDQAAWLSHEERQWLVARMSEEEQHRERRHGARFWQAMVDGRVWFLICLYFTIAVGTNASGAHAPKLIETWFPSWNKSGIGVLSALPHLCAMVGMTIIGWHSDRKAERRGHLACSAFLAVAGWTVSLLSGMPWIQLLGLCIAQAGMMSMLPIFWALPTSFLSGAAAAGASR